MKKNLLTLAMSFFALMATAQYVIYPIPHEQIAGSATVSFTEQVLILCSDAIDQATKDRATSLLEEKGLSPQIVNELPAENTKSVIYLGTNGGSNDKADEKCTQLGLKRDVFAHTEKFDNHLLHLFNDGGKACVVIVGKNTDATFFGLASLEQILDKGTTNLKATTLYDYADIQNRGLVEGYYGYPYSVSVKKDLFRFMMRYKMNTYLYGAKSDPYHSEKWKDAYPTSITQQQEKNGWLSQNMIRDISKESQATKVNFIWAIHPGNNFINSSTVVSDIMSKFTLMHNLGVRQFGIFVDDVGLPSADKYELNATRLTEVQQALENKFNKPTAEATDTVRPLHFVPQIYALGWVGASEREGFYKALSKTPSYINIYITGWGVWSIPNSGDLNAVSQHLGRKVAWWWNYPCNDNADGQLYTKDMYSNFYDLPAVASNGTLPTQLDNSIAIVSNPMQEGELSKIALFSVADYSWNTSKFQNIGSWRAAVKAVVGEENAEDFEFLSDYLRYNDPDDFNALINNAKNRISTPDNTYVKSLVARLEKIISASERFLAFENSSRESDRLFFTDIAPWLRKLHSMATSSLALVQAAGLSNEEEAPEKWSKYINAAMKVDSLTIKNEYVAYALEGMGSGINVSSRVSQPAERYFKNFVYWLRDNALNNFFSDTQGSRPAAINNLTEDPGNSLRAMQNNTTKAYYLTTSSALAVPNGRYIGLELPVASRLSAITIADTLAAKFTIRYSANGRDWKDTEGTAVPDELVKQLILVNKSGSTAPLRLNVRVFSITPAQAPTISSVSVPEGDNAEDQPLSNLTDGNYDTWWAVKKTQANNDAYTLTLAESTPIYDVRVCVGTKNEDYMNTARVEISENGTSWVALPIFGGNITNFTLTSSGVATYNDLMKYATFDGKGRSAKYVRLRVTNAKTNKWLRLYEIEVNKQSLTEPVVTDANGMGLAALTDQKANTHISTSTAMPITYSFTRSKTPIALTFFQKAETKNPTIQVTEDGTTWSQIGTLTSDMQIVELSNYPAAKAVRLVAAGGQTTAPLLYEVVETSSENELEPTGLPTITLQNQWIAETAKTLGLTVGRETTAIEIYSAQGKRLFQAKDNGTQVSLPMSFLKQERILIVRMLHKDGTSSSRKIVIK